MTFCMSRVHAVLEFRQGIVSLSYGACGKVEVVTVGQLMSEILRPGLLYEESESADLIELEKDTHV